MDRLREREAHSFLPDVNIEHIEMALSDFPTIPSVPVVDPWTCWEQQIRHGLAHAAASGLAHPLKKVMRQTHVRFSQDSVMVSCGTLLNLLTKVRGRVTWITTH